jgi:hypothetical protein
MAIPPGERLLVLEAERILASGDANGEFIGSLITGYLPTSLRVPDGHRGRPLR